MRRKYWILSLVLLAVIACSKNFDSLQKDETNLTREGTKYKISQAQALGELEDFLSSMAPTKVDAPLKYKQVKSVRGVKTSLKTKELITKSFLRTKSSAQELIIPDTLLYIADFETGGYAILSADSRIPSIILAITESGSISLESFNISTDSFEIPEEDLDDIEEFYIDDDGEEWADDEEDNEFDDDNSFIQTVLSDTTNIQHGSDEDFIGEMVYQFAIDEIGSYDPENENFWYQPVDTTCGSADIGIYHWFSMGSSNSAPLYEWRTVAEVPIMLTTKWGQDNILNKYCPNPPLSNKRGAVGCVPIAAGQIITYNLEETHPSAFMKYVYPSKSSGNYTATDDDVDYTAKFLRFLGAKCKASYLWGGTFAWPVKAKNCFHAYGYTKVHRHTSYKHKGVVKMLETDRPVFVAAIPKLKISKCHAWVIDGYKKQVLYRIETNEPVQERSLVHCNWGWRGMCNGYYYTKLFDLKRGAVLDDDGNTLTDPSTRNLKFTWWFRTITYDKPQYHTIIHF